MSRIDIKNPYLDMQYTYDLADLRSVDMSYEKDAEKASIYRFILDNKDKFRYFLYMLNTSLLKFYKQDEYRVTFIAVPDDKLPDEIKEMITNMDKNEILDLIKYNTIPKSLDLRYIQSTNINYLPTMYLNQTVFFSNNNGNVMLNNKAVITDQVKLPYSTVLIADRLSFPPLLGL
jgi:hypothetical protein